ncbi:uncharacterized protein LOC100903854 [Galendromus occidentalis]|uniref:Uncharacterized protein LOC100903854 n=1 Tax=Galendromus occidentalis TaxID=34638 RepID=A0AAJ6QV75_9ACAR|nr:uncharacterized protein LOC100903854 [Galendromus occidentalis]
MALYPPQQMADILYSFKAFGVLPTEIADQIQDLLEDELTQSMRSLVDDVFDLNCFKEPVDRSSVERSATLDTTHYDSCLDRISAKLEKLMSVPPHVLLPGDECFRNADPEARTKRMQIRNQIKLKMASNRELRGEVARLRLEIQVKERLAEAIQKVTI